MDQKKYYSWVRLVVHLLGILPLASLVISGFTGGLGVNPIQEVEQRLGRAALYFLVAALSITPLVTITGWQVLKPRRRTLGLYSFSYASLHFITFIGIDYGFDFREIGQLILEKPYILVGFITGLFLLLLAITSFDASIRRLGKHWKSLHRLAYLAGSMAIIHYAWAKKGNLFSFSGDILQPLLWGGLLLFLLILRIPTIRKQLTAFRLRITMSRPSR